MTKFIYYNGKMIPHNETPISAADRGFLLGDGIFETMLWHNKRIFRLNDHWERLKKSAEIIGLDIPFSLEEFNNSIKTLIKENGLFDETASVRMTISRESVHTTVSPDYNSIFNRPSK